MVHIMNYKVYIYALVLLLTTFALSSINFTGLFKINHNIQARISFMLLDISITYLVSNFVIDIISFT